MVYKIYLASRFPRQEELRGYATRLEAEGHTVTARWLEEQPEDKNNVYLFSPDRAEQMAYIDLADIRRADVFLTWTEPNGSSNTGGGRHIEFGYAYALGKRIICIGEKETVFHHMIDVEFYPDLQSVINELNKL